MEGRGARYVIGYCVTVLTAVLLWCLRQELGGVVMDVLLPKNGSAWEQGKLCFWPYLAGGLLIWRLGTKEDSRGGHCALLVLMPLALTAVCYFVPLHNHQVVLGAWLLVLAAGIALYGLVLRRHLWGGELLWYTLAILMGIAYLLLTAAPPEGTLFADPMGVPTMAIPV